MPRECAPPIDGCDVLLVDYELNRDVGLGPDLLLDTFQVRELIVLGLAVGVRDHR